MSHVAHKGPVPWRDVALFAFVGMAVLVPIALLVDSDDVTIVKGPVFSLLVAGAVFVWLGRSIGQRQLRFVAMAYQLPLAAFLLLALLSTIWSNAPDASLSGGITLSYYVLTCLLCVSLLEYPQARIVVTMALATGACVAVYGLLQRAGLDILSWGTDFATAEGTPRVFATMGHPNFLGSYMVLIFSLATARAVSESTLLARSAAVSIAVLSAVCMLATLSRGAWVGCSVSCLVIAVYQGRRWLTPRRIAGICIIAVLAAVVVSGRLISSQNVPARMALWESAFDMILVAPVWGHGYNTFATIFPAFRPADYWLRGIELTVGHAHNEILESIVELGIVGLLLLLWCAASFFRSVHRAIVNEGASAQGNLLIGLTAGIAGMLVHSLLDVGLRWPAVAVPFWLSVGLASVVSARAGGHHLARGVREVLLPLKSIAPGFRWISAAAGVVVVGYVAVQGARQVMADRMLMIGTQASSADDWSASAAAYEDALAYEPNHVGALYKLGAARIKNGEPARALKVLGRLEELSPGYAEVDRNTGLAHIQLGNIPMAVRRYETAARLDSVPPNWFDLGQVYELNGQEFGAVRAYETYLPLATTYILQHEERAAR
ncbi:MAG: tetratricopeptide repeat protein, partial [Candidatus Latescibacteria bacterium]|nr:tetratricopeptide repeat protein [Candidatus Latescibacterota bacterium]